MSFQEYLPFILAQFQLFYQYSVDNPLYAVSLGGAVWLATAVIYGFRIGGLKREIRKQVQVLERSHAELEAARSDLAGLGSELELSRADTLEQARRAEALQRRIDDAAAQISAAILHLAAQPDLGQQGLTVHPDLSIEQLWQRFSIAVQQLEETLSGEKRAKTQLQAELRAEEAKSAEKDLQLQAAQLRFEEQRKAVALLQAAVDESEIRLRQALEEQEARLLREQQRAAREQAANLAVLNRAELNRTESTRMAELERQAAPAADGEPAAAAASMPAVETSAPTPRAPGPMAAEILSEVLNRAPGERPAPAAEPTPTPVPPVAPVEAPPAAAEAAAGGLKSLLSRFSGARSKIEQLDRKLEERQPRAQEISQAAALYDALRQPEPAPAPAAPEPRVEPAAPPVAAAEPEKPKGGKLGGFFSSARQKIGKLDSMLGQPDVKPVESEPDAEVQRPEPRVEPAAPPPVAAKEPAKPQAEKKGGFFSSARQKIGQLDAMLGQPDAKVVEPEPDAPVRSAESRVEPAAPPPVAAMEPVKPLKEQAGKSGGFFSNARQKISKLDAMLGLSDDKPAIEPEPEPEPPAPVPAPEAEPAADKPKGMFGRFKR